MDDLDRYLDAICGELRFCPAEVRVELKRHIEQAAAELGAAGHPPAEALEMAIGEFGDPAEIAAGLAEAHRHGGGAMFRRVITPALIAVGVLFGAMLIQAFWGALDKYARDSVIITGEGAWMPPVIPTLHWLVFVGVFLAVHLCAGRGGAKRECLLVGLAPLIVGGLAGLGLLLSMAGPAFLALGVGFGHGVVMGNVSLGTAVMARQLLQQVLGLGFTCLAATWLYFFAARRMQERAFWLAAEE